MGAESVFASFEDFAIAQKADQDVIVLKRAYCDMTRDVPAALILSQILFWNMPDGEGKSRLRVEYRGAPALARNHADWWGDCRVPPAQAERSIKTLCKLGLIRAPKGMFNGKRTPMIILDKTQFIQKYNAILAKGYNQKTGTYGGAVGTNSAYRSRSTVPTGSGKLRRPITSPTASPSASPFREEGETHKSPSSAEVSGSVPFPQESDGERKARVRAQRREALGAERFDKIEREQGARVPA